MAEIEARLQEIGLQLPAPIKLPPGMMLSFPWVPLQHPGRNRGGAPHPILTDCKPPLQWNKG